MSHARETSLTFFVMYIVLISLDVRGLPFLVHLSHRLKVSFCDLSSSVMRHPSVNNLLKTSPPKPVNGF